MNVLIQHPGGREAHALRSARSGALWAVREFGALRCFVDHSGSLPSYLRPDAVHRAFGRAWLRWADAGGRVEITPAGEAALTAYDARAEQQRQEPSTITRNPMLGEQHDPREAIRVLRTVESGEEIRVGDVIADPFGTSVTYLGPTMSRISGESIWLPGFIARVLYPVDVPWVFLPTDLGAAYEDAPSRPA